MHEDFIKLEYKNKRKMPKCPNILKELKYGAYEVSMTSDFRVQVKFFISESFKYI